MRGLGIIFTKPYDKIKGALILSEQIILNTNLSPGQRLERGENAWKWSYTMPEYNKDDTILGDNEINRVTKKILVTRPNQPRHLYTSYSWGS